jgi:outer membrane protein TolC
LIHEQIKQVDLLKKDIQSGIEKTNVAIANGIALKSEADVLKAELLKSDQKTIELKANLEGYVQVLSLLIHQSVDENTKLVTPPVQVTEKTIHRPELILYDVQYQSLEAQRNILTGMNKPKIGLFLQGGYGRPALNFLDNRFDFYYIGGLKFNWLISNRYTYKNDNQIIALNQFQINAQRETFLFNTNVSLTQQESEISKLNELIVVDDQIIDLYENIKNSYEVQLQNGIITSTDYLTHVNAIDVARQNQVLHHVQLLMTQYNYKTTSGN